MTRHAAAAGPVLTVEGMRVTFATERGMTEAVHDVSFELERGKTLALLGESGSGKSVTALALMGLLGPGAKVTGRADLAGNDLFSVPAHTGRRHRGRRMAMVFQDALDALNPVHSVGAQVAEAIRVHDGTSRRHARRRAIEMLGRVSIPNPRERYSDYPHQFSGGMRQRVVIAMALALEPEVLIADEPTTALDVTVQAQILELLQDIQAEQNMAVLLITHDLGVANDVADRIAVMYAGRLVEVGDAAATFTDPVHPYTTALIASVPGLAPRGARLPVIPGVPPSLRDRPSGCAFHPRCPARIAVCSEELPLLRTGPSGGLAACHLVEKESDAQS
jgi:oligopeptide transport system ATP-binding protein